MLQHGFELAGVRWLIGGFARALPFALYALIAAHVSVRAKLTTAVVLGGLIAAVVHVHPQPWAWVESLGSSAALLSTACAAVFLLRRATQASMLTRPALAVLCIGLFLLAPELLIAGEANMLVMVLGFELTFSAFSYCVEKVEPEPDFGECMRFLLVNPLLVYQRLSLVDRPSTLRLRGFGRVLLGIGVLLAYHTLVIALPFTGLSYDGERIVFDDLAGYRGFVAMMLANLLVLYLAHSGLASLQIGCMRLLGYDLPERYRMPFLARSPDDLWRRWNTYLGAWLKRYVFAPTAAALLRRKRRWSTAAARIAPLVATFALCGLIHDVAIDLRSSTLGAGGSIAFGFAGLSILIWMAIAAGLRRARWPRVAVSAAGVVFAIHSELLLGFVALPTLAGEPLPAPLRVLWFR